MIIFKLYRINMQKTLSYGNHTRSPRKQKMFPAGCRIVSTVNVKKIALTAFDTKRWLCNHGVSTLTHGHVRKRNNK